MEKVITTVYIPAELQNYARVHKINISRLLTQALQEHSGTKDQNYIQNLETEVKNLKIQLSIKETLLKNAKKKAKNAEKKAKIAKKREKMEEKRKKMGVSTGNFSEKSGFSKLATWDWGGKKKDGS